MARLTFFNDTGITITSSGLAPAQMVEVFGFGSDTPISDLTLSMIDLNHTFAGDLDVLLVAPDGISNLMVMSDVLGGNNFVNATVHLNDLAAASLFDAPVVAGVITPGTYRPFGTAGETDADFGTTTGGINTASGDGTVSFTTAFFGLPGWNGAWQFIVRDDAGADNLALGSWQLTFATMSPTVRIDGTVADDVIGVTSAGPTSGTLARNGAAASYEDVAGFVLAGDAGNDSLSGGVGDDSLIGGSGEDILTGGAGRDIATYDDSSAAILATLALGGGQGGDAEGDRLIGIEDLGGSAHGDTLTGNAGENRLYGRAGDDILAGRAGADTLDGGDGFDMADYVRSSTWVTVSLVFNTGVGGDAQGDVLAGIEAVQGSHYADEITGNGNANRLLGRGGADQLWGRGGNDTINGGAGADTIKAGIGNDRILGGGHSDRLQGGDGRDSIVGGWGNDTIYAGTGNDTLQGGSGNDRMFGGTGADQMVAGLGHDRLDGGRGNDRMTGGGGEDDFVFRKGYGRDRITDFNTARGDELQLDDNLWQGAQLSASQVVSRFASVRNGNVVFDFGSNGQLTLEGLNSTSPLAGAIDIF